MKLCLSLMSRRAAARVFFALLSLLSGVAVTRLDAATSPVLTLGAQKTLVMLVNFADNPGQPWTPADAHNHIFGDASNFYFENSYGQTWLVGDVAGWYTLPMNSTCDVAAIATAAKQAAVAAGYSLAAYQHYIYAYPANATCGMSGQGTIGGNPSELWINGDLSLHTVAHEMGHNFGLYHSNSLKCDAGVLSGNCTVAEYGDLFDTMGMNGNLHFNAFQKERLGWLNYGASPPITLVQSSGTYLIAPYETADSGSKALKILRSTDPVSGAKTWYYIEFRRAFGYDSGLATMPYVNYQNGVYVHLGTDGDGRSSRILNMTPNSGVADWYDVALVAGQSFTDGTGGVTIAPLSVGAAGISVAITLSAPTAPPVSCTRANPKLSLVGSGQSVGAGSTLSYTLSVTNQDSSGCTADTFSLSDVLPSGWNGSFVASSLTIAPGATVSTTLAIASPIGTAPGTYSLNAAAASGGYQASAGATYTIASTSKKKGNH